MNDARRTALLNAGLVAASTNLTTSPDEPLNAIELAMKVARPAAKGAVVISGDDLEAVTGAAPGANWREAAKRARTAHASAWTGTIGAAGGQMSYAALAAPGGHSGARYVIVAGDPPSAALNTPAPLSESRRVAEGLFSLVAPLVVSLLLMLVLMRQTRKAAEAMRGQIDSERRFRLAVEAARCGVWEWRLDDDTLFMSDVMGAMLGWGGGGVAKGADVIARIAPEHQTRVRQSLRDAQAHGGFDVSFHVPGSSAAGAWLDARGKVSARANRASPRSSASHWT